MTLDDFFTLTEMNNGLVAPSRVRELVAVMQKESDCVIKNIGEATRQWQAVASTIGATENQECLDLFIQLDGLRFLVKWLKDAQKFGNDPKFDFVVESITHMLRALVKLHVGCEKQVDSEMWATVKDLLIHNSSKVQDGARVLYESLKEKVNGDASPSNVERSEASRDDEFGKSADLRGDWEHSKSSQRDHSLSGEPSCKEKDQESTRNGPVLSASADSVHPETVENSQNSDKKMNPAVGDDAPSPHIASPLLVDSAMELLPSNSTGATSKTSNSATAGQETYGSAMDIQESESASEAKHAMKIENSSRKLESLEEFNTSEGKSFPSSSDAATEVSSLKNPVAGCVELSNKDSVYDELRRNDSDGKGSVENSHATDVGDELKGRTSCKSSSGNFGAFIAGIVDRGKIKKHNQLTSNDSLSSSSKIVKNVKNKEAEKAGKKSDVELLGMVDPLEVARQVAMEVEQEVVGYREQSGSASEKQVDSHEQRPGSPDSVSGRQSNASESSSKDATSNPDSSAEASTMQEESETSTKGLDAEQTDGVQNMASSQGMDSRKGNDNRGKDPCNFDLNEECLEDADIPRNELSTPVAVVSASRAVAAVPGLPAAPLQFEGNLGWKGSAATSAFRRASPRRMLENGKDFCAEGNAGSSKPRQGFDIDLNVSDSVDGRTEDSSLLFSTIPSVESNVDTTPRRSGQLQLDLNHTTEDGARPIDWQMRPLFPLENGHNGGAHPSSSKLPYLKNIDLNDQPSFLHDSSSSSYLSKLPQNLNVSGAPKSDNSVISLMGTRVEVNRKDGPQTMALSNGRSSELSSDVNSGRSGSYLAVGSPYAHSSVYGYNYVTPGPVAPFSSTMYASGGPIPYMVDTRGTPVIPQLVGSASGMPGFSQTPFYMNMSNPMPSNGSGAGAPSRSSFDLNSGMMVEGGNRDPASFAQFLNLGPVEQVRSNSQTSIVPVVGGKRKEPDNNRWDHYPFKHYTPPWK